MKTPWSDKRVARMIQLYAIEGRSARATAEILGPWCTRNAVIGKHHRITGEPIIPVFYWQEEHTLRAAEIYIPFVYPVKSVAADLGFAASTVTRHMPEIKDAQRKLRAEKNKIAEPVRINLPETKQPWQCLESGCKGTIQGGRVLCAEHITERYVEHQRTRLHAEETLS